MTEGDLIEIPLFPLSSVLLPKGKMALQIFEPRYLDLISRCLKTDTGFGVVWLTNGTETVPTPPPSSSESKTETVSFMKMGTYAHIVDWDSLPNGLLGVTIEGGQRFRVISSYADKQHLHCGSIEWLPAEAHIPLPENAMELQELLRQLTQHPHVQRLQLNSEMNDVSSLGFLLTQMLPIGEDRKYELLCCDSPSQRLQQLMDLLEQFNE